MTATTGEPLDLFPHSYRTADVHTVDTVTETDRGTRGSIRPVLQTVLLDVAPPLGAYYGLRAAGTSEYVALLSATVVSGVRLVYSTIKAHRLDPFALYLLLTFGLSLAVGLSTHDPKSILIGHTLVNGIGGLIFLGSCVIGTPLTQVVVDRFRKSDDEPPADADRLHRIHAKLSAMWGIGLLIEVAIRLVIIGGMSVDVANGVNTAITLSVIGVLSLATVIVIQRSSAPAAPAT
jgi:uncharacterized membrane protein